MKSSDITHSYGKHHVDLVTCSACGKADHCIRSMIGNDLTWLRLCYTCHQDFLNRVTDQLIRMGVDDPQLSDITQKRAVHMPRTANRAACGRDSTWLNMAGVGDTITCHECVVWLESQRLNYPKPRAVVFGDLD